MTKLLMTTALMGMLTALAGLSGCARKQPPVMAKGPPEVEVSQPLSKKIHDFEEFSGHLESAETVMVRARVTGYLQSVKFDEGGIVQKGQVLFEIDPLTYEAQLARAKAALVKAQAALSQADRDWRRAREMVNQETKGAISREEYDKFYGIYQVAKAEVDVAKADLHIAQINMDYTKVRAPIAGRISKTLLRPGNMVKADDTILTTIGASNPIKAYFDVDERTVARVLHLIEIGAISKEINGTPVWMGLADEEGRPHKGTIDFLDISVDQSTGTLQVRGRFDNPNELLVPGMFVRVRLPIGQPQDATLIAEKALVTDQGQKYVYVVKDEKEGTNEAKVEYRRVQLGRLEGGMRVIKDGLAPNEKVVVSGLQRVRPDITVKIKPVPMPVSIVALDSQQAPKSKVPHTPLTVGKPGAGKKGEKHR